MSSRFLHRSIVLSTCCGCLALASLAQAQLVHRYSFSETSGTTVIDSVGGAHGTIVDTGTTTNFDWTGSQLNLSANLGENSNAITEDAYVDLPNGLISAAFAGGARGQAAFEIWGTVSELHTWQRYWDFGTSNDGEDTSNSGSNVDQIWLAANSGRHGDGPAVASSSPVGGLGEVGTTTLLAPGTEHQLFASFNHNSPLSGPNGTIEYYIDGIWIGRAAISPNIDLNTFHNNNNWLGRSQWADPIFDGSYNEFRIYNAALPDSYFKATYLAGPDTVPPIVHCDFCGFIYATVDRNTGTVTVVNVSPAIDLVGISITSASGALVPGNVLSVTDNYDANNGGAFDPDNEWQYETPTTAYSLDESEPVGDGGQLGIGGTQTSLLLGGPGAYVTSQYEDLFVTVQRLLPDFTVDLLNVPVSYVGGLGMAPDRSDLDVDGDVDVDDYQILVAGHLTDLLSLTPATSWGYGDLNGDLKNNFADFSLFQQDYDAANGVGAFAALQVSIPEPSTLTLVLLTGIACTFSRRRLT